MTTITYIFGYVAIVICLTLALSRVKKYTSRPLHIRWELYPVPHEGERAAWGGSYLENTEWHKKERTHSLIGMAKGLAEEMLLLHLTFKHNRDLWFRTYPFHAGIYLCFGGFGLTFLGAILGWSGTLESGFVSFIGALANLCFLVGKIGIVIGGILLIHRRVTCASLRVYTTPEHYFNLLIFILWALLGIIAYMTTPSYFVVSRDFLMNFLTFNLATPIEGTFPLPNAGFIFITLYTFALMIIVPATHMAHLFMKYFTWHNIRWDDTPTLDDEQLNAKIMENLVRKPTWSADHIAGDGKKTWAEIAMHNPMAEPKEEETKE